MPLSSGTFTRLYDWVTDRNNGVKIRADRMDEELDGIATALSTAVYRDGSSTISANIPFNNKKITGLGDATSATDALNRQTADARYIQAANNLTAETSIADADVFPFYDDSAAAMRKVTYANLKTDLAAETAFMPASKVTNTAAGTISATTVQDAINELDAEKVATSRTLTAAGLVTGGGDLSSNRTFTVTAATESDQETGTSTTVVVTPGRQHFHPSAAKVHGSLIDGGTASLESNDYGVSSVDDNGTGLYDFNFDTAFSGATYSVGGMCSSTAGVAFPSGEQTTPRTTTAIGVRAHNGTNAVNASNFFTVIIYGDL